MSALDTARPAARSSMWRHLAAAGLGAALLPATCLAAEIDWALVDRGCAGNRSAISIACGSLGVYHLVDVDTAAGCQPVASGREEPGRYVAGHLTGFSIDAALPARPADPSAAGAAAQPDRAFAAREPVPPGRGAAAGLVARDDAAVSRRVPAWIAVVDFAGVHGKSTSWLVSQVAGPSVSTTLSVLDDPALAALGSPGDFHVLAKLCEIAEWVDVDKVPPPRAVNMSFGRGLREGEGNGGPSCNPGTAVCQIYKVIDHLRGLGTAFVAAAGNHREMLFPAGLDNVLAVGMLELNSFFASGQVGPAWETPPAVGALVPGNGLCFGTWAAPSGSSYASALLTGWLSEVLERRPWLDPLSGGAWAPRWLPARGCFALSRGNEVFPWCNETIRELFQGLLGANADKCWSAASAASGSLPASPGGPEPQPPISSFTAWTADTSPAPESDPCVPCVGILRLAFAATELELNLSQSGPMPAGTILHGVYLRVGDEFRDLSLSPARLLDIQQGKLSRLVLAEPDSILVPGQQPSLWYEMKTDPFVNCRSSADCFWSSTPIFLPSR